MRGWLPLWATNAFLTQDPGYMQTSRVNAFVQSSMPCQALNEFTGRVPTYRGSTESGEAGDYPGLGANRKATWYVSNSHKSSDVEPRSGDLGLWQDTSEWSHMPNCFFYTLLTEGGAHLLDGMLIHTSHALLHLNNDGGGTGYGSGQRQVRPTANDPYSYAQFMTMSSQFEQTRGKGWMLTAISNLASIIPDASTDPTLYQWPEKQYWLDVIAGNFAFSANLYSQQCW